jgi:mRNA-degrading endonuclease RelE of RelBE toxin-antitoxin system
MWSIIVESKAVRMIEKLPKHIAEKYAVWSGIVRQSGPQGLRAVKSFHDEKIADTEYRSSRLSLQWRVKYSVDKDTVTVRVERVGPHDIY